MNALAELSPLEQAYDQARENFEHIVGYLDSKETSLMTHNELERELEKKGRELMRKLLQEHLDNRGPGQCGQPVQGADGVERPEVRLRERKYDRYLAKGLPIATGGIEGACRHLVKDRMNVTGARWTLTGAEAVLQLRALRSSHDFDEYWTFHETKEYERNHRALYAGGIVPHTTASLPARERAHLKLIK